ncbi:MAG: acyl-CoA dehydrogenase family protein [Desulfatibacillaceae bacterium]
MFSFSLDKEQKMVRDSFAELVKKLVADSAHDMDEAGELDTDAVQKAWELGASVSAVPEECGGLGLPDSPMQTVLCLEELAWGDAAFAVAATMPSLFISPVLKHGTDKQKDDYLPPVCGEQYVPATMAMCEPDIMFDAARPKCRAERKNGSYVITGEKCFVPGARDAKYVLVAADSDDGPQLFIVSGDNPGMQVGDRDKAEGFYALDMYRVKFDNCEIPAEDRLGGDAGADYRDVLARTRTGLSAIATGISRASYDVAREYAKTRVQFGDPIGTRQSVAFMVAEMAYETDAMRLMTWQAASALEAGKDAVRESYLAKMYVGEMAMKVCDYGVQVMGGHGYIRDYPQERCYRNARGMAILEGFATV